MKANILFFLIFSYTLSYSQIIQEYVKKYKDIAVNEMYLYNIPASITLAQGILESGSGESNLAVNANNHFGIKCHIDWSGSVIYHDDDEKQECFRKYNNVNESYRDHSLFLSERKRYAFLFELRKNDYKGWAKGLQQAGYATNKTYAKKLIKLINDYNLDKYDHEKSSKIDLIKLNGSNNSRDKKNVYENNFIKYVIAKEGQLYDDIAEEMDVWLWELLKYNECEIDRFLFEGEKVYLQPKRRKGYKAFHIVLESETMYSISQLYGIKLKHLYKKNRMEFGSEPYIGQKLNLQQKLKF
ncbi:MAG: hypothetical protein CMP49_02295 [Flavobacteriales bacterium]|nr:hypothetical protein [Flavobacteriales bacterium]|tara:strand:+ start:4022 stop:4915 length:894 start_codon:yes stop_codon:yes gene_type:complete